MKTLACLILTFSLALTLNAQKYKRSTETYDFSFASGKMKVVMKDENAIIGGAKKEMLAEKEILLYWNKWAGTWAAVVDGKIGDSLSDAHVYSDYYSNSICFIKRGDKLIVSEFINVTSAPIMQVDPDTGEEYEQTDEMGNTLYFDIVDGGYFEMVNLKDGKSLYKKDGECLKQLFGEKFLVLKQQPAEDTYYSVFTLIDLNGKLLFESLTKEDIYADDNLLSSLVTQPKADKILFKSNELYADQFAFVVNGKMGYSSIGTGVTAEPVYDFAYVNYDMTFYLENNVLKAKNAEKSFEGKNSIQTHTYQMDGYTEYFVDGVQKSDEEGFNSQYSFGLAYSYSESFVKIGDLVFYSSPYYAPEEMYYEGMNDMDMYKPTESELGLLLIYDTKKKQVIFNQYAHSLMNFTDKGILIRKTTPEEVDGVFEGKMQYTYTIIDNNGNAVQKDISQTEFNVDPKYMLSLLPAGSIAVSYEESFADVTLTYLLNGKIGVFSAASNQTEAPALRWRMNANTYEPIRVTDDKVIDNMDTNSYSGNSPYFVKAANNNSRTFYVKGSNRFWMMTYDPAIMKTTEKFGFSLTDTSYSMNSIEFKNDLVVQNVSGGITKFQMDEYEYETGDMWTHVNDAGDTLYSPMYTAKSGVFDKKSGKWLVPAAYYRVAQSGKYFFASEYVFPGNEITKMEFAKATSKPIFSAFDETGKLIIKGTAAEVKKKTGVDPSVLNCTY